MPPQMVLKETLAYCVVDVGSVFCTFLDATKAFDRIDYCKLFCELLRRDLPVIYRVVQITDTQFYFWDNFGNSAPILTILSLL